MQYFFAWRFLLCYIGEGFVAGLLNYAAVLLNYVAVLLDYAAVLLDYAAAGLLDCRLRLHGRAKAILWVRSFGTAPALHFYLKSGTHILRLPGIAARKEGQPR